MEYKMNRFLRRSAMTLFPQRIDGKNEFRIWNRQLISYAGYANEDGTFTGDPMNVDVAEVFSFFPLIMSALNSS